jgi:hypothetical protein
MLVVMDGEHVKEILWRYLVFHDTCCSVSLGPLLPQMLGS